MRRVVPLLLLFAVCVGCQVRQGKNGAAISEAQWQAEVLQSGEPVVVDFWATWCGPCQKMHPVMDALAKDYKVKKVDVDANSHLTKRYEISGIPAILIFKGGEVVARHEGPTSESVLRADLQKFAKQ